MDENLNNLQISISTDWDEEIVKNDGTIGTRIKVSLFNGSQFIDADYITREMIQEVLEE